MSRLFIVAGAVILFSSCVDKDKQGNLLDTPTTGSIIIAADESLKPLIDAEISAFEGVYRNADIEVVYTSEGDAIKQLLADSARLCIVTRKMAYSEEQNLLAQTIVPNQLLLAKGGVALICNKEANDSVVSWRELKMLLSRGHGNSNKTDVIVFDQPNSGIIRFLRDTLDLPAILPDNFFAVQGNSDVVEYVSKNQNALGLIDLSWISDSDDSTANVFLNTIKVLAISDDSGSYKPYQAYIAQKKYPLLRDVMVISREARAGLASGFMAFMASDKGQRIVLKSGLVPATMPIRIVEINHEPF